MPTIAESIQNLHDGAEFLHDVATGPAAGAGSQVTNPADATVQDSLAKTIADAKTEILTETYLKAVVKEVSGTTYTCLAADTGKILRFTNGSAVTVTAPTSLDIGWNAVFFQEGAGTVSFTTSGTTIHHVGGHTQIEDQYGTASLVQVDTNVFVLGGQTS